MRVAIVSGICIPDDAISAAVESQARTLLGIAGVDAVDVFAQALGRQLPCPAHLVGNSWELLTHPRFATADVAIFHWGIHFDVFDALAIMRGRVSGAPGPLPVVHFHNCTPRDLVPAEAHAMIDRSIAQAQLMADTDVPVWTFSPFNEATLRAWGVRDQQLAFVPFAVEPPRPLIDLRRPGRVDIASVGRMVPAKGQHVIIEALALVPSDVRERMTLTIAGNELFSSADYVRSLHERAEALGLGAQVRFCRPDDDALWRLYEQSAIVVSASLHEGLCVPVLEAYSAGCRVIGTDAGNLPHIVQPPDPVVPTLDPAALAAALEEVGRQVLGDTRVDRDNVRQLLDRYSARTATDRLTAELRTLTA